MKVFALCIVKQKYMPKDHVRLLCLTFLPGLNSAPLFIASQSLGSLKITKTTTPSLRTDLTSDGIKSVTRTCSYHRFQ